MILSNEHVAVIFIYIAVALLGLLAVLYHRNHKWVYTIYNNQSYYECAVCHKRKKATLSKEELP